MGAEPKLGGDVTAALVLAVLLTLAGLAIGDSSLGLAIGLVDAVLLIYSMCRVPLRNTMIVLTFFVFALPNPAEGQPSKLVPPFTVVGAVLLNHLNTVDRSIGALSAIPVSGLDIIMVVMTLIILYRRSTGSKIDTAGRAPTPKPLVRLAVVAIGGALFSWFSGLVRGGDFGMSLWQVSCVVYLPLIFLLFHASLRGPRDHAALVRVLLGAAVYKCCLAVYVIATQVNPMDPDTGSTRPQYATSHNDSMLFAAAFVLILATLMENARRRDKWLASLFLPILTAGTIANNRRLAWVQVALVFLTVYLVSRETEFKRKTRRLLFALTPVIVIYLIAGWNSQFGGTFKPVRMIRSVVDANSDGSSQWREFENVNLIATFRDHTLFGTGFGHPYEEIVTLPRVDYSLERYTPHNSLLGVWCYGGYIGYTALTLLWMGGVYFAMRTYNKSADPAHRIAALVSFGAVLVYMLQSWGDLGLGSLTGMFMMGCSLAVAGKLATASGQWSERSKSERSKVGA